MSTGEFREQRFFIETEKFGRDVRNGLCQESGIGMDVSERFFGVATVNSSAAGSIVKEVQPACADERPRERHGYFQEIA
ncbi:hypothetical protein TNCT_340121 [Trichonephila clavata]|uniref:Uncharacterized protein n=1 Tax=Trichonephila clavata TaxID=2740835 RepID=A0A8X6HDC8_TRICU|nr:hypothetical protein TNCT_340121 [Trichonephila clavata]